MKVNCVGTYGVQRNFLHASGKKRTLDNPQIPTTDQPSVNFKGCDVGKVTGFILGTAAVCVFAPAVAMVGLAGIGSLAGAMAGAYVDEKIDESNEKNKK